MLEVFGVGTRPRRQLLAIAGVDHDRLRSEAAFAALCSVAPVPPRPYAASDIASIAA